MNADDAEVVIAGGCLLHDIGMSIHRVDHEAFSLFLAADLLDDLLGDVYEEPERTIVAAEVLHAIIGHRSGGRPLTLEAGVVRVADALDMEHGRSRVAMETQLPNIHSLSAAAIDEVRIVPGEERTIRVEVDMNNSAGVFQVDELLATKLRGSGLEKHIEVIARIDAEHEKRLLRCTGSGWLILRPTHPAGRRINHLVSSHAPATVGVLQLHDAAAPAAAGRSRSRDVAHAIADADAMLGAIDLVRVERDTRGARRDGGVRRLRARRGGRAQAVRALEGVKVDSVSDRTFLMHKGGKIEVRPKLPLKTRDDLSMAYTPGVGARVDGDPRRPEPRAGR